MTSPTHTPNAANPRYDLLLVGGGLQNALIALAVRRQRPQTRIAIVERDARLGGNHTWCLHHGDATGDTLAWLSPLFAHTWSGYDVRFPGLDRTLGGTYAAVTSERLHQVVCEALQHVEGCDVWLGQRAVDISASGVRLANGRALDARLVVDARGPAEPKQVTRSGFQKFLGLELQMARPHGLTRPLLMDATVEQTDGFRFMYLLPFDGRRLLVEDTTFSRVATLDETAAVRAIRDYAERRFGPITQVVRSERGVLPMPWATDFEAPVLGAVAPLTAGYAGGYFHPGTGYSMPAAIALAECIADAGLEVDALQPALDRHWRRHRTQAGYAERLNWLLFNSFEPADMWNVFARFYRLPEPLIHRFYALDTTLGDRARIVVGRPPRGISVRTAWSALAGGADSSQATAATVGRSA